MPLFGFLWPLLLIVVSTAFVDKPKDVPPAHVEKLDFKTQIQPILEARCKPCHFAGGKMYEKLPFDRPATIVRLGERLFTRIKDESSRAKIRAFLAQQVKEIASGPPSGLPYFSTSRRM